MVIGIDKPSSNSRAIASKLESEIVRFFFLKSREDLIPFSRASENRKYLLEQANGTYAMILDGDDYYIDVPDEAVAILDKRRELAAVQYNFKVLNERKRRILDNPCTFKNHEEVTLQRYVLSGKWFHLHCAVFRRLQALDLEETLYFNDGAMQQFLLTKGNFLYLTKNIMMYRVGIDSIFAGQKEVFKKLQNSVMFEELYRKILKGDTNRLLALTKYNAFVNWIKLEDLELGSQAIPAYYFSQIKERKLRYSLCLARICRIRNQTLKKIVFQFFRAYIRFKLKREKLKIQS